MFARFVTIAAAALAVASSAVAQPVKTSAPQSGKPSAHSGPVVLASAEEVGTPSPTQSDSAPVKRPRAARVTTCRCGGEPQAQQDEQQ